MLDWGGTTELGWVAVSRVFLRSYNKLGISPEQAMTIIHILDRQWGDQVPFPKVGTIAEEMGLGEKTVRGYLKELKDKGFLNTTFRMGRSNQYDFSPLFSRLLEEQPGSSPDPTPFPGRQPTPFPGRQPTRETPGEEQPPEEQPEENPTAARAAVAEVDAAIARALEKTANSKHRQHMLLDAPAASPVAPPPQQGIGKGPTCNDLELAFKRAWSTRWPNATVKRWTGRERKNAKDMIAEYGYDTCAKVIEFVMSEWKQLLRDFRWNGYPSMPLIYGYRGSLVPLATQSKVEMGAPKWGAHFKPEAVRPDGEEGGWGNL